MLSNGHHSMTNVLPKGTAHEVYVTHVSDGPYTFCVQPKNFRDDLFPKISSFLRKNPPKKFNGPLRTGSLVLSSRFQNLRRSAIVNSKQKCEVYFLDYGFHEEVSNANIYEMPQEVCDLAPAQAIFFTLGYIRHVNLPENFKYRFKNLVYNKEVLLIVLQNEPGVVLQCCELFLDGKNVREVLFYTERPNLFNNLNYKSDETFRNPCIPRFARLPVNVVFIDSPGKFFIHYSSNLKTLQTLDDELSKFCPKQNRIKDTSRLWLGKPVGTLFSSDNHWYRAVISGILDKYTVNVFYVDYGNTETVNTEHLCDLSRQLITNWNSQALECSLIGFENAPYESFIANKLEYMIINHFFMMEIHFLLDSRKLVVDLIDKEGNSIAVLMKKLSKNNKLDKSDNSNSTPINLESTSTSSSSSSVREFPKYTTKYFARADSSKLKFQHTRRNNFNNDQEDKVNTRLREGNSDKTSNSAEDGGRIETSTFSNAIIRNSDDSTEDGGKIETSTFSNAITRNSDDFTEDGGKIESSSFSNSKLSENKQFDNLEKVFDKQKETNNAPNICQRLNRYRGPNSIYRKFNKTMTDKLESSKISENVRYISSSSVERAQCDDHLKQNEK